MAVEMTGRNVTVTNALRALAEKGTRRLERHLGGPAGVRIVVWQEKHVFNAEVIVTHRRRRWTSQEQRSDLEAAVAFALEKIDTQARKNTERRRDRKHRAQNAKAGNGESVPKSRSRPSDSRVVRAGRLPIKPMSVEEAALAMDASDREFLVFRDASSERVSVLYKRRDGDLGLIVPED